MKGKSIIGSFVLISGLLCAWSLVQAGELHDATKAGNVVRVQQLLDQGAYIDAKAVF